MWRSWLALGCKVGSLPPTYLGLPLGAPHRSLTVWDGVEERMRKNLARWKSQDISKGGRITLIRSTLASMPIYYMSMFSMPRKVRLRLEHIQRDFLWGGGALEKKPHLVRWSLVCLEKSNGGLGVKCLSILNKALLCKWSWRFALTVFKDAWVKDVWCSNEGGGSWNPFFSRPFNDWELDEVCRFFLALNGKRV